MSKAEKSFIALLAILGIAAISVPFLACVYCPTTPPLIQSLDFDANDAEMLMKIAKSEGDNETVANKAKIMIVVLNRVWDEGFPNTVESVILASEFGSVKNGKYFDAAPDKSCELALGMVRDGWNTIGNALYFKHPMMKFY